MFKVCSKCRVPLATGEFHKDRTKPDGYNTSCKGCVRDRMRVKYERDADRLREKSRLYREANPDKIRSTSAQYRTQNKQKTLQATQLWRDKNPELVRSLAAQYRAEADKEVVRERMAEWRRANPDKMRAQNRSWRLENKEAAAAIVTARRARKAHAEGRYTALEIDGLFAYQKGCCAVCRAKLGKSFHRDHIIPLSRGGSNYISNIQLLCGPCNLSKGAKDPVDFMQRRGFLL